MDSGVNGAEPATDGRASGEVGNRADAKETAGKEGVKAKEKKATKESKPKTKKEQEKKANDGQFGLVDNDRFEELKKRLREKLNQLNMGIDPDILASRLAVGNNGAIE